MQVSFGTTQDEKNKLNKNVSYSVNLEGYLRNETNVVNPTIKIQGSISTLAGCNYMYIPAFGRKYFITDIKSINSHICEVSGHCDVLATYNTSIRTNKAIVGRTATQGNWNLYLTDPMTKVNNKTETFNVTGFRRFGKENFTLLMIVWG